MATLINRADELREKVGAELGVSDWHRVTQEQVNTFAEATGDDQWIHVDVDRATAGPFGGTIAHGFLTLSLCPVVLAEVLDVRGLSMGLNYGLNRVRFPAPVPVGTRVRASVRLVSAEEVAGGIQAVFGLTFEAEGSTKPVCVADWVVRYYT